MKENGYGKEGRKVAQKRKEKWERKKDQREREVHGVRILTEERE